MSFRGIILLSCDGDSLLLSFAAPPLTIAVSTVAEAFSCIVYLVSVWYNRMEMKNAGPAERWLRMVLEVRVRPGSFKEQPGTVGGKHWPLVYGSRKRISGYLRPPAHVRDEMISNRLCSQHLLIIIITDDVHLYPRFLFV